MGSLPRGIPVEIEVIVEVEDAPARRAAAKPAATPQGRAQGQAEIGQEQAQVGAFDRPLSGLLSPRVPTGTAMPTAPNSFRTGPDERGHFGIFGGRYVAETLMPLILELEKAYNEAKADPQFQGELNYLADALCRPAEPALLRGTPDQASRRRQGLLQARRAEPHRQHKINNVLGQVLLAKRMGKTRVIAETGAGQHGVATATACALFDIPCVVFMGSVDVDRQAPNVARMKMLGAEVRPVTSGSVDAQGRDERGAARLGRDLRDDLLLHRHGGGPAPLSGDGARLPVRDRQRDAQADDGGGGPAARHAGRLHRRRLERDGPVPSLPRRSRACASSASRRRARASRPASMPRR